MSSPELSEALAAAARMPRILVATDFDGTLAEIVEDPTTAGVPTAVVSDLSTLGRRRGVSCHVISGRCLADLRIHLPLIENVGLWGSYGAEAEVAAPEPDSHDELLLDAANEKLGRIVSRYPDAWIERKPLSLAFHTRKLGQPQAEAADDAAREVMAGSPLHAAKGKRVIEWCVLVPDKSTVVKRLRASHDAGAVIYLGDDHSDEWVFRASQPQDVMIKVGEGATTATYRLDSVHEARGVIRTLLMLRPELALPPGKSVV